MVLFGLIKCLRVFHQSRGPVSVFLSFAANLSITDCFALRISAVVMFRVCLYFSKSAGRFVFLYFLYKRLRFLIIFFISHVNQGGSDWRILIVLFGMCCFASVVIRSIMFLHMRLYRYLLKVPSWFHEDRVQMIDSCLGRIAKYV